MARTKTSALDLELGLTIHVYRLTTDESGQWSSTEDRGLDEWSQGVEVSRGRRLRLVGLMTIDLTRDRSLQHYQANYPFSCIPNARSK